MEKYTGIDTRGTYIGCAWTRKERIINMYTKIGIPENNSLKSKIEELYEWCDKRDNDDELGKTYFNEPIDEDSRDI